MTQRFLFMSKWRGQLCYGALWDKASQCHLSIVAQQFCGEDIYFFLERDGQEDWRKNLDQLQLEGFVKE
jgi:hypothetical protein